MGNGEASVAAAETDDFSLLCYSISRAAIGVHFTTAVAVNLYDLDGWDQWTDGRARLPEREARNGRIGTESTDSPSSLTADKTMHLSRSTRRC
ncbi:unnamed protein product, partial [Mesorhabditis spiculigera]